jgi:hypothetical protein
MASVTLPYFSISWIEQRAEEAQGMNLQLRAECVEARRLSAAVRQEWRAAVARGRRAVELSQQIRERKSADES